MSETKKVPCPVCGVNLQVSIGVHESEKSIEIQAVCREALRYIEAHCPGSGAKVVADRLKSVLPESKD